MNIPSSHKRILLLTATGFVVAVGFQNCDRLKNLAFIEAPNKSYAGAGASAPDSYGGDFGNGPSDGGSSNGFNTTATVGSSGGSPATGFQSSFVRAEDRILSGADDPQGLKAFRDACAACGLRDKDKQQKVHQEISDQGLGFHEIKEVIRSMYPNG